MVRALLKPTVLQENSPAVSIDGHEDVPENDENALLKAVSKQPVAVAIDAGSSDFQFYSEVSLFESRVLRMKLNFGMLS